MSADEHQEAALRTWYPAGHLLHDDLLPSIIGVASEAGELLDELKKIMYKPGYHRNNNDKLIAELVDVWYYLRIVAYQLGITTDDMTRLSAEKLHGGKHGWVDNGSSKTGG